MIIYSNKINQTELLRSLSNYDKESFNLRIINLLELLENVNSKLGFKYQNNILSSKEIEERILLPFIDKLQLRPISYQDISHFISTLNDVRKQITDINEFDKFVSTFSSLFEEEKSLSLLHDFYRLYLETLSSDHDEILAIREIIKLSENNKSFDCVFYFKEDDISPLEKTLLNSVANQVKEISVLSLYEIKNKEICLPTDIIPCYGIRNEINHVISDIYKNKHPLDQCLVVLVNNDQYVYNLYEASKHFNIPMSFSTGIPISLTDPYKLYQSIKLLGDKYFYDVNGYLNFLNSESLDLDKLTGIDKTLLAQLLGRLKVNFDKKNNDLVLTNLNILQDNKHKEYFDLFLEKIDRNIIKNEDEILSALNFIINEFSKGVSYVIDTYSKDNLNDPSLFDASRKYIIETIDYVNTKVPSLIRDSYLSKIDNKYLSFELSSEGKLHVCGLMQALSINRKYVYFIGLNASNYPGDIKEDFLFSDKSYFALNNIPNSSVLAINRKNELLKLIIDKFISLDSKVILSYNCQEITEARELNACSALLDYAEELFKEENKRLAIEAKEKGIKGEHTVISIRRRESSYYDDNLNPIHVLSDIALENKGVKEEKLNVIQMPYKGNLLYKNYSPSKFNNFLNCKLKFYLDDIEYIDNEIKYDPLNPIAGNRFGDLFHYVFEKYVDVKGKMTLDELIHLGNEIYDSYTLLDRSIGDKDFVKKDFIKAIRTTHDFLSNFDLSNAHAEFECLEKLEDVHFKGSIDLVCKDKMGRTVIIDYKTGNHLDHKDNDIKTCVQGIIYSHLYEKITNTIVNELIFFYPRYNKKVTFDNPCDISIKDDLKIKLISFSDSLKNLSFPPKDFYDEEEGCKYCKYRNICKVKDKPKE